MGVLDTIFSAGNVAKRRIKDLARNPMGVLEQTADELRNRLRERPEEVALDVFNPSSALGGLAGVVKPKGGNWLTGSVEDALKGLVPKAGAMNRSANSVMEEMLSTYPTDKLEMMSPDTRATVDAAFARLRPQVSIQNWIEGPLTKYVKTRMASPDDEVRKLAEQGVLHFDPPVGFNSRVVGKRKELGYPEMGVSKSQLAQSWEGLSDTVVNAPKAETYQNFGSSNMTGQPGWEWINKVDPESRAYGFNKPSSYRAQEEGMESLGFPHLIDELRNALDPASGLPRHLRLEPKAIENLSMEKAVRRVADINKWRAAQKVEANRKLAEQASLVREYAENNPKGLRWVELKANPKTDELGNVVNKGDRDLADQLKYEGDVMGHCVGGYCDDVLSGRSRIFSLRDAKGEPHVTVEVDPGRKLSEADLPDDVRDMLAEKYGDATREEFEAAVQRAVAERAVPQRIVQIKGKQNRAPNEEYLPFVQDFVRNSPLGGQWVDVGDLGNTGLKRHGDVFYRPEELDDLIRARGQWKFTDSPDWETLPQLIERMRPQYADRYTDPLQLEKDLTEHFLSKSGKTIGGEELLNTDYFRLGPEPKGYASGGPVQLPPRDRPSTTPGIRGRSETLLDESSSGYNSSVPSWDIFAEAE